MNDKTVSQLYERLPVEERALIALRLWKEDKSEPHLLVGMSSAQGWEYNRHIELLTDLHQRMVPFVLILRSAGRNLSLRVGWYLTLLLHEMDIDGIAEDIAEVMRARPKRDIKLEHALARIIVGYLGGKSPTVKKRRTPQTREELMETHLQALVAGAVEMGAQLAAADSLTAQVSEEFGGEDPLHPIVREGLEGARADLQDVRESMALKAVELPTPEPDETLFKVLTDSVFHAAEASVTVRGDE